jgi:hypothetical protein
MKNDIKPVTQGKETLHALDLFCDGKAFLQLKPEVLNQSVSGKEDPVLPVQKDDFAGSMAGEANDFQLHAAEIKYLAVGDILKGRKADAELFHCSLEFRLAEGFLSKRHIFQIHVGLLKSPVSAYMIVMAVGVDADERQRGKGFRDGTDIAHAERGIDNGCQLCTGYHIAGGIMVIVQEPDMVIYGNDIGNTKFRHYSLPPV